MRKDRIAQLIARYAAAAATSIAVLLLPELSDDQKASIADFAATIGAGLVGIVGFFVDLFIHRFQNGGFMAAAAERGGVSPNNAASRAATIKGVRSSALPLFLSLTALSIGVSQVQGCASGPLSEGQMYMVTSGGLVTATDQVTAASQRGQISLQQLKDYRDTAEPIRLSMDAWGAALEAGEPFSEGDLLSSFSRLLDLVEVLLQEEEVSRVRDPWNSPSFRYLDHGAHWGMEASAGSWKGADGRRAA